MIRRLAAGALCALAPLVAVPATAGVGSPVKPSAHERHARCVQKPLPGARWCPQEWAARPSWHRSSLWYVPEAWLRAKLERIARCESGGRPDALSPGGTFRGKFQFLLSTWRGQGGAGDPAAAPEREQDWRAAKLYRAAGPGPWPVCGYR